MTTQAPMFSIKTMNQLFTHLDPSLGLAPAHREYLKRRKISFNKYPCPFSISISDMTRILTRQELKNTDSMLFIQDEGFILFPSLKILTLQIAVKRINAKQKN